MIYLDKINNVAEALRPLKKINILIEMKETY